MIKDLVSVCIPTHNGEEYLKETLDSLKEQSFQNFEVIICDDGSKDSTLQIIEAFKTNCERPVLISKHLSKGIGANWNNCLRKARGEYIKFLFQDDILKPDCLQKMEAYLRQNPEVGLVASKRDFKINIALNEDLNSWLKKYKDLQFGIDSRSGEILILDHTFFKCATLLQSPLNKIGEPSAVMFRSSRISEVGYFRTDLKQILDYEYWYRFLINSKIAILPDELVIFRIHSNQETQKNNKIKIPDLEIYPKLIYKKYGHLLNPNLRSNLASKYNTSHLLKKKILRLLKRIK